MKKLFICENHHNVLLPWTKIRQEKEDMLLLTFDHHTDTHKAFISHIYEKSNKGLEDSCKVNYEGRLECLINKFDYNNEDSVRDAISILKNDEHIWTALKCDIIRNAFVISYDGEIDSKSDIYVVGTRKYINNSNCISDDFLKEMLKKIKNMNDSDIMNYDYILDIDLDYFHNYDAINRNDINKFKELLSRAYAITIATEPEYAKVGVDVEIILKKIITWAKEVNNNNLEIIDIREQF